MFYDYLDAGWIYPPEDKNCDMPRQVSYSDDGIITSTVTTDAVPQSPEDLLRLHGYDPDKFELVNAKCSQWNSGNNPQTSSKVVVKPKANTITKDEMVEWFENLKNEKLPVYGAKKKSVCHKMMLIPISDLHYGLLCEPFRTGESYNQDIAESRLDYILDESVRSIKENHVDSVIITIGGDMMNFDNLKGTTTRGTPQDNSGGYYNVFHSLFSTMVAFISSIAETGAFVRVIYVPGNHDEVTGFHLAELINAWFRCSELVKVDYEPKPRKYDTYGNTLLVFAHDGDVKKLPQLIADEARKMWSMVNRTDVYLQHLHTERVLVEDFHMRIQRLPTVCGRSAWTTDQGYLSDKVHKNFIYDKEKGIEKVLYINF